MSQRLAIEIRHLQMMTAIVEEGSITKAGARMFLTQSALSHQLRDIEDRLGTDLFTRRNRQLQITPAGRLFLDSARDILERLEKTQSNLGLFAGEVRGRIRLSTECYTSYHWLPKVLKQFNTRFPQVDVEIDVHASNHPIEALREGRLDLALAYTPARDRQLTTVPLFQDELVALVHPQHALARKPYVAAEDFSAHPLISYSSLPEDQLLFRTVLIPAKVTPPKVLSVQLTEAILELAKAGLGIGVLCRWAAQEQIQSRQLVAIPITKSGLLRNWRAVYRKERPERPYLTAFASMLDSDCFPNGCRVSTSH